MNVGGVLGRIAVQLPTTYLTLSAVLNPESHTCPIRYPLLTLVSYLFVLWKIDHLYNAVFCFLRRYTTEVPCLGYYTLFFVIIFCLPFLFKLQHGYCNVCQEIKRVKLVIIYLAHRDWFRIFPWTQLGKGALFALFCHRSYNIMILFSSVRLLYVNLSPFWLPKFDKNRFDFFFLVPPSNRPDSS